MNLRGPEPHPDPNSIPNTLTTHKHRPAPEPKAYLDVRQRELDLTINTAWPNQGRVQRLDSIGRHDDLDVTPLIETIKLVEQLEHGPLDLTRTALGLELELG